MTFKIKTELRMSLRSQSQCSIIFVLQFIRNVTGKITVRQIV